MACRTLDRANDVARPEPGEPGRVDHRHWLTARRRRRARQPEVPNRMAPARILVLLVATALAAGACSAAAATIPPDAGPSGSPDRSAPPSGAPNDAGLILRATLEGG